MTGLWTKADGRTSGSRGRRSRNRPALECLEERELLTGTQPYLLSGDRWSDAAPITYSIAADGVAWDRKANVLNAAMDARFAAEAWQGEVARALQTWASVADVDFVRVADSASAFDAVGKAQGDARFGDIRFGGYAFSNASELAHAYGPPPNGSTAAGDVALNTAMAYNIGDDFDLFSVVLHEAGHSLGLGHPDDTDAVMGSAYGGLRAGLEAGDIAGIRAIYGARADDAHGRQGRGVGLSDAVDVAAGLVTPALFALGDLALTTIGDSDYFSVVAPTSGASLRATAIAVGVSLLGARVSVYDASGALLDLAGDGSAYGLDVTASVAGVVAGQRYYIEVSGATADVFAIGSYGLEVAFVGGRPPDAAPPSPVAVVVAAPPAPPPSDPVPAAPAPPAIAVGPSSVGEPGPPVAGAVAMPPATPPASPPLAPPVIPAGPPASPPATPPPSDPPATSDPAPVRPRWRWRRRRPRFPGDRPASTRRGRRARLDVGPDASRRPEMPPIEGARREDLRPDEPARAVGLRLPPAPGPRRLDGRPSGRGAAPGRRLGPTRADAAGAP
jgi:hypothetical protein